MSAIPRWLSKISIRLLAFNILPVFLPVASMLFLDTYELHLLKAQERTMVQEGRLLAASLEASATFDQAAARQILVHLSQRHEARLRILDHTGTVVADSALLGPRRISSDSATAETTSASFEEILYDLASLPFRLLRGLRRTNAPGADEERDIAQGPEVQAALEGRYGATTRVTGGPTPTVTLYSAIPVRRSGKPQGVVLVSQSTTRIMQTLRAVRLDIFKVFLASVGVSMVLSLLIATTIARPLARLRRQAERILDRTGRLCGSFTPSKRRDEIGDLERALAGLTDRLEEHLGSMESFTADVSHEFKNPLASIRTATEMALDVDTPQERERFLTMIQRDVARMERLLTGAREISRIDASLEQEEQALVDLEALLSSIVEAFRLRFAETGLSFNLTVVRHGLLVSASPDRLTQVIENLLDNAVSFSPARGKIAITLAGSSTWVLISISDEGPGIPREHRDRIFSRFFSYREAHSTDASDHAGLGLAIVKAIVEGYGGTITAENRKEGGSVFTLELPRVQSV